MRKLNPNADGRTLVPGDNVTLRIWSGEVPGTRRGPHSSPYEIVGYVLQGGAELTVDGDSYRVYVGDTYFIPKDTLHTYSFLTTFSAVEGVSSGLRVLVNSLR